MNQRGSKLYRGRRERKKNDFLLNGERIKIRNCGSFEN